MLWCAFFSHRPRHYLRLLLLLLLLWPLSLLLPFCCCPQVGRGSNGVRGELDEETERRGEPREGRQTPRFFYRWIDGCRQTGLRWLGHIHTRTHNTNATHMYTTPHTPRTHTRIRHTTNNIQHPRIPARVSRQFFL